MYKAIVSSKEKIKALEVYLPRKGSSILKMKSPLLFLCLATSCCSPSLESRWSVHCYYPIRSVSNNTKKYTHHILR